MLKFGILWERETGRKCSWHTCCVKMLSDIVIEKCSWPQKSFIGTVLVQSIALWKSARHCLRDYLEHLCQLHRYLEIVTVQNVTHHPYIVYRLQASLKNVFSTKWKKSLCGNMEYSDNTHEGGSCFDRVSSFPNIHKFPHRTVLELSSNTEKQM